MVTINLRFELRENSAGGWRLVAVTDRHAEHVCDIDAGGEWSAVDEVARLLGEALRRIAADRAPEPG